MMNAEQWLTGLQTSVERYRESRNLESATVEVRFVDGTSVVVAQALASFLHDHVVIVPHPLKKDGSKDAAAMFEVSEGRVMNPNWLVVPLSTILRVEIGPPRQGPRSRPVGFTASDQEEGEPQ